MSLAIIYNEADILWPYGQSEVFVVTLSGSEQIIRQFF